MTNLSTDTVPIPPLMAPDPEHTEHRSRMTTPPMRSTCPMPLLGLVDAAEDCGAQGRGVPRHLRRGGRATLTCHAATH